MDIRVKYGDSGSNRYRDASNGNDNGSLHFVIKIRREKVFAVRRSGSFDSDICHHILVRQAGGGRAETLLEPAK